jgi:hypothetical protein
LIDLILEDQYGLERTVIIQGSPNQVKHAVKLVQDFCAEPQALFMHVPADKAGLIIVKAGQTVKQVRDFSFIFAHSMNMLKKSSSFSKNVFSQPIFL